MNLRFLRPFIVLLIAGAQVNALAEPSSHSMRKFDLCRRVDRDCDMRTIDYTVCDAYLKHLNTLPADKPVNGCRPWINPAWKDFTLPDWEVLVVRAHLDWIYEMEQRIFYDTHPPTPDFDTWRREWLDKVDAGELHPRLKRTRLALAPEVGEEEIVAYDSGGTRSCKDGEPGSEIADKAAIVFGGYSLFVRRVGSQSVMKKISTAYGGDVVLFAGKPYWSNYLPGGRLSATQEFTDTIIVALGPFGHLKNFPRKGQDEYVVPRYCRYDERLPTARKTTGGRDK